MSELPKQHWRFELGKFPKDCKIFLNDELWNNVISLKIEAGCDVNGRPIATKLTLQLFPSDLKIDIGPSLQGDVDDGLFGARHTSGDAQQPR